MATNIPALKFLIIYTHFKILEWLGEISKITGDIIGMNCTMTVHSNFVRIKDERAVITYWLSKINILCCRFDFMY